MPLGSLSAGQHRGSCPIICEQRCITTLIYRLASSVQLSRISVVSRAQQRHYSITSRQRQRADTQCSAAVSPPQPHLAAHRKPRLAIFVSGGGSNFRSIHAAVLDGHIHAEMAVVITDVPGCGGWEYAASHGIPTEVYPAPGQTAVESRQQPLSVAALVTALKERYAVDYVLLAGYVKLIPEELVREYKRAMLNIHPALLPAFGGKGFYGGRVHRAVIASGARFSGPTIHFVDEGYDTGPILAQSVVPVWPTDTPKQLAARVLKEEHRLYPLAVAALVDGRVNWRADGIPVMWTAH